MSKVAIVEDDTILRDILANKLSREGFLVVTAIDGEEALTLIKNELPDLLLLDLLLPKKNGIEVLEEKNKDDRIKNIPVIAISNSGEINEIEKVKSLGVKEFLIKAIFDASDVVKKVKLVIGSPVDRPKNFPITDKTPETVNPIVATPPKVVMGEKDSKRLVMIIEDDKFLRELAGQKLEKEGFNVMGESSGKEALEVMRNRKPDVIILDLILPGMDGYEVLQEIKGDVILANIPVIILSNLGQEEDIAKAKQLGATDYMVKAHFSFGEIIAKIHEVLGNTQ